MQIKSIFIKISIYLNVILFYTLVLLSYKFGLDDLSAISNPIRKSFKQVTNTTSQSLTDTLVSAPEWQSQVKQQVIAAQEHSYDSCLFGDSISAGLGRSLGPSTFNFALNGMSTVSLVEQLKILTAAKLKCPKVIIAIGTNDAWYTMSNQAFLTKMEETITLARQLEVKQMILIPAFYATVAASHDPSMAGSNERVDEINALMRKVAAKEQVAIALESIKPLFQNHALNEKLTVDGVHLNEDGLAIYRLALLSLLYPGCKP